MGKINLKTLSQSLGLAESTVSRALNDYPTISAHTRRRVQEAASRMGYRADSKARRLATGNAECIGYVMPWRSTHLSAPLLAELLDGLAEAMAERQWDLTVATPRTKDEELLLIERLARSGRVNGLVVSRILSEDRRVTRLMELGVPFVCHGRTSHSDDYAWLDIDGAAAFEAATRHMIGLGHRRIAMIGGPAEYHFAERRQIGYRAGLDAAGIALDTVLEVVSDMTIAGGYDAMRLLLSLAEVPTAVVCISDMVALGAMRAIHQSGRMPGRDISVIGYDGLPIGDYSYPALTTMEYSAQEAGRSIGEMLLAIIDGDDPRNHQRLVTAALHRRESDGPPPGEPAGER